MRNNYCFNLLCSALLSLFGLLLTHCSYGQVTGTVFKDFNINGVKDNTATFNEVGMSGVQVIATKPDGSLLTVTYTGSGTATNGTGGYAITGGTLGQIRLNFIMPDDYTFAANGASGGTTVLFPSSATQNLAVNYPADYCGVTDPLLVTSCYVGNNAAGVNDVLVKYAYSSSGVAHSPSHTTIALANQIGSTYGLGYDKTNQTIYAGAFLKRHIPLKDNNSDGKEDLGAIYKIPASGAPSLWLDVTTLGIDVGMALMPTIATRALPIPATTSDLAASHDTQVFSLVGKIGLGDIDISDDNSQLFFVNLNDSKIYTVDLATKTLVGPGIAIPSTCTGGNARPFALAYHRGKLYVGAVCDAATSKVDADMKATVYRLDGATFTSILSFPLNYTKGAAFKDGGNLYGNKWNPWEDSFSNVFGFTSSSGLKALCEPQPIFADLLFDTDESLIIVLNDRLGHQTGTANYQPSSSDKNLYYGVAAGDLLRASLVAGTYTLEKNGSSGGVTTAGANNGQGPGTPTATGYTSPSGEFYVGDDENGVHEEVVAGGAALIPGRGQVAVQVSDPAANYFAGGTYRFNNTTGEFDQAYVVFIDPSFGQQPWLFGKANGLGDLEVLCNNAPIEIGNRVWNDLDSDGIQDAGETGIAGVSVSLCTGTGTLIATATTDPTGNYYFSSGSGTNTASALYGLSALTAKTAYTLKFPTTNSGKSLVTPNASADNIDSDAPSTGVISFSTAGFGANDHTFDVGYGAAPCSLTATATAGLCASATNQYTASGTISLANNTAGSTATITDGAVSTTVSIAAAATSVSYTLPGLLSGTGSHTVTISLPGCGTAAATYSAPASCTVAPVQLAVVVTTPVCNSATNNYTATGTVSLTNATAGTLTITDNGATVAVLTITAGQTSASFSVSGLSGSGPASHTVTANLGSAAATTTYATPASCTVCTTNLTTTSLPGGQVGTGYNQTLTTTGGTAPYTYTVSAGTLPGGLTLNPATGAISGVPTAAATSNFTIKVTDAKSCTDVQSFTIVTSAAPVCSLVATAAPGTCNAATNTYSVTGTVSATNTTGNQSLTIAVGSTNTTVTLTGNGPVSYTLTGLLSDGGAKTLSVISSATACGSTTANFTAPASCTVAASKLAVVVSTPVCNSATNNYTATGTVSLTNATAGTLTITNNGTSLTTIAITAGQTSATFTVSGVSNGPATRTVVAAISSLSATTTYVVPASCTVCTVSLTTSTLPNGQVGTTYSQTLITTGGTTPYNYTVSAGTLPAGLTLDPATGVISGVPTAAVTSNFTIKVTDSKSCTDVAALSITTSAQPVCSLVVAVTPGSCNSTTNEYTISGTVSLTNAIAGTLTITDGTKSTTAAVTASTTAVAYSLTGFLSGSGSHTVLASLTGCGTNTANYTAPASCSIAPPALAVVVGTPVCNSATNNYTATGTVSLTNATAGTLTITNNGTSLTTIAITAGQTSATFTVSGVSNGPATRTVVAAISSLSATTTYVVPASCTVCTVSLTTSTLPNGQVGTAYSRTLVTTGGTTPYTYTVSAGTLPAGLALNPTTGVISGTSTAEATSTFTIKVTDAKSCTDAQSFTIVTAATPVCSLDLIVTPGTCNSVTNQYTLSGTVGLTNPVAGNLVVTDGIRSTTLTITASTTSVTYSLTGLTSGSGSHTVVASLAGCGTDNTTYTAPTACTLCTISLTTTSLPNGQVGLPYSRTISATGGTLPLSFTVSAGTLPAGITLSPTTGVLSGTPTASGNFPITIRVTDAKTCSATVTFATFQIDPVTQRAMAVTVNTPICNPATDRYTATGTVSFTNSPAGSLTITDNGTIVSVITVTAGQTSASFSLSGLSNGPAVRLVSAVLGTLTASTTYTSPASCTACTYPVVVASAISSTVSEGQAATVTASVTPTVGLTYVWSAPAGITLVTANTHTVISSVLPAGVHTFTVTVTNQAGCSTTATTCVSVPFTACQGSNYAFQLDAPTGYTTYEWRFTAPGSTTSTVVQSSSATSYLATQAGEYGVIATKGGISTCPDGSCCPIIIAELPTPPAPSLTTVSATCNSQTATLANNDAKLILSGTALTGLSYNIVKGSSFTAAAPLLASNSALPTTAGSVLMGALPNPTNPVGDVYTVRIFSAAGCFTDVVVTLTPSACSCPPAKCVPVLVRVIKKGRP